MKILQKNRIRLTGIVGIVFCVLILSGAGYPDDDTVIIGPDLRNGIDDLYNLHLEIPNTVTPGSEFTARLSIEGADGFATSASATVSVTGGTLENEQTQELVPDAVWKIHVTSDSLVGIVANVQTKVSPKDEASKETTYLDTVSGSTQITKIANTLKTDNRTLVNAAFASPNAERTFLGVAAVVIIATLFGFLFFKKLKKNRTKKH